MKSSIRIRRAQLNEADELSAIAMESKAYWGYSTAFMEACRNELSVSAARLANEDFRYYLAERAGRAVGYYALERLSCDVYALEALFVLPANIGRGIGRRLMDHAIAEVGAQGGKRVIIEGDPHAEGFYLSVGAVRVGCRESRSIPDRYLPLFTLSVARSKCGPS